MDKHAGVAQVIFDAARRRFEGQVFMSEDGEKTVLSVSAPGHPSWGHRRIKQALIASAEFISGPGRPHARS